MSATDQRAQSAASGSPGAIGDVSFRAVIDGMLEGVAILDHEWRFQYVNEAGAQNLGGTRVELLGRSVFDHYPGLRDSPAHRLFTSCLEDGTPQRFEAPFPGADGSLHWFEFSVQPCGEGVLVLSLDITDRHVAADSNVRLQAALESIDLVAISLDPAGRLMFANGALVRTTGWTREEVLGTDWFARFVPESIRSDLRSLFDEAIRTGEVPRQHEHNLLTRDGRERTVVWNNTILRDGDGTVTAVAAVGEDVTDRRALEAGLRQNSASVEAALDASADIVAIFRPILDPEGRFLDAEVVHANAAALHRWRPGVPFEQIYGHGLLELIPGLRSLVFDLYEEAVRTGREVHDRVDVGTGRRRTDILQFREQCILRREKDVPILLDGRITCAGAAGKAHRIGEITADAFRLQLDAALREHQPVADFFARVTIDRRKSITYGPTQFGFEVGNPVEHGVDHWISFRSWIEDHSGLDAHAIAQSQRRCEQFVMRRKPVVVRHAARSDATNHVVLFLNFGPEWLERRMVCFCHRRLDMFHGRSDIRVVGGERGGVALRLRQHPHQQTARTVRGDLFELMEVDRGEQFLVDVFDVAYFAIHGSKCDDKRRRDSEPDQDHDDI